MLSYLTKDSFKEMADKMNFVDKISEFVEYYSQINTAGSPTSLPPSNPNFRK